VLLKRLTIGLALMALASCADRKVELGGAPNMHVVQGSELPPPDPRDLTIGARPYLVGPFDKLTIDVFGMPELQQKEVQVDAGGRLSFPLAGVVDVLGKTPSDIEGLLRQRLMERYIRDPQVTVNLKEAVSQIVTIDGDVNKPGQYPVLGRMTLMRAVATAEGTTEFSNLGAIVVFRKVNGQDMAALYDLGAIRRGAYPDPDIYGNDVIVVGDSHAKRLFKDFLGVVPLLTTPLILLLQ
jgi:polysaccharide export outer membrane protein